MFEVSAGGRTIDRSLDGYRQIQTGTQSLPSLRGKTSPTFPSSSTILGKPSSLLSKEGNSLTQSRGSHLPGSRSTAPCGPSAGTLARFDRGLAGEGLWHEYRGNDTAARWL